MDMHKGFSIGFSLSLIFLKGLSSELTFPYGCQLRLDFHNLDLLSRNEKGEIFLYTKQQRSSNSILGYFTSCIYFRTLRDKIKLIRGGPVWKVSSHLSYLNLRFCRRCINLECMPHTLLKSIFLVLTGMKIAAWYWAGNYLHLYL